jgi:hypothetical protein
LLLDKTLESITQADNFSQFNLVVLHQIGFPNVENTIRKHRESISMLVEVDGAKKSPLENINWNRIATFRIGFDIYKSKFVLGVEDDTQISKDSLTFCLEMYSKYRKNPFFRGINFGSFESGPNALIGGFTKLSYGLHGQAGVITDRTWKAINRLNLLTQLETEPFDARIEGYLKTGFMITSNRSRFIDEGWGGTHAPSDKKDKYFSKLRASWVGDEVVRSYSHQPIFHNWRRDSRKFHYYSGGPWLKLFLRLVRRHH